ncbi:hypothetical protein OSB04_001249 [Centaurea solstitialis]|uniref:EF-hand domain-containing protein n=1 Tax=Centaurea solstitialis TaxID=347529 RepID=A0AA38U9S4_9ASTR|nr:hypothetical protein OSB04_001249 [Centaurea solstitialis]
MNDGSATDYSSEMPAMETNGGNLASSQTAEIVVVPQVIYQSPPASSDVESETDNECAPCFRTLGDYLQLSTFIFIYLAASVVCFSLLRHQISGNKTTGVLDAFYFTYILMTSVGYGDLIPNSTLSILLATLFAILGMLLYGGLYGLLAEMLSSAQEALESDDSEEVQWDKKLMKSCLTEWGKKLMKILLKAWGKKSMNNLLKACGKKLMKNLKAWGVLAFYFVLHMAIGIPVMVSVENLDFVHAFYCINATLISVGSDNCFSTKSGRIFALFWIPQGVFIITFLLFKFTELYTQRRETTLVKMALEKKMTPRDLEVADLDGDGYVTRAEFILYMLNEMEKLRREDIEPIIEEYQRLDVNTIGRLRTRGLLTSDGGNQTSLSKPLRPSYKTIPIPSLVQRRKIADYFPWCQTSFDLWKIITILSIYLGAGTAFFYLARDHISGTKTNNILDALFFTLVLTTSVGYGDLSPNGTLAILLSSLFSLLGRFLITVVLSMGAYVLVKQPLGKFWRKTTTSPEHKQSNKVRNKIIAMVILFLVHMAVGTAILISIEDLDFIHAFYCISVTITSAGSHQCFSTKRGRVLALSWILLGTIYKGYVLFIFTELYTQRTHRHLERKTITTTTLADLEAADLDRDGVIAPAEYILHKLKQKGKIDGKDEAPIVERFAILDVDKTVQFANEASRKKQKTTQVSNTQIEDKTAGYRYDKIS